MTTTPSHILTYAEPAVNASRPWCRNAGRALAWVLACPVLVWAPLVYAVHRSWLPQHFLCCEHEELAVFAFSGTPLIGAAWGAVAMGQILWNERRTRPRGIVLASLAFGLGLVAAAIGVLFLFLLNA